MGGVGEGKEGKGGKGLKTRQNITHHAWHGVASTKEFVKFQ